jgi:hypothetical protein
VSPAADVVVIVMKEAPLVEEMAEVPLIDKADPTIFIPDKKFCAILYILFY